MTRARTSWISSTRGSSIPGQSISFRFLDIRFRARGATTPLPISTARLRLVAGREHARVVVAHTPPKGHGAAAIDWALGDVNAGDAAMAAIVDQLQPRAALFAHVDEAGGRATDGERINVGGVERGVAVILELDAGRATHRVVR